jgi:hypothetical protein
MISGIITWLLKGWLSRWVLTAEGEIKDGWRWLIAAPEHILTAALALSIALNLWLWHRSSRCTAQVRQNHTAQAGATAAQIQANQQPARISAAIARQSDAQAPAYYAAVRSAAAAHTVVMQPRTCPVGPADLPGPDPAVTGLHGPAPASDLVSRPKADDDLIIAAAARGAQMHQEALDLIASGAAVADNPP